MSFASLGLSPALVRAASDQAFSDPTPIQAAAIPVVLQGRDVLATARTGSGKTAAYGLPVLQALLDSHQAGRSHGGVLVLVPTRELATQVADTLRVLSQSLPVSLKVVVAFGGVSINPQMMALRGGADIVVATPGRLLDLIDHHALGLGGVSVLVLDEADRLFDLGFADEMQRIVDMLPPQRQSLFFSATFPQPVQALANALLHEPERIEVVQDEAEVADIEQRAIEVDTQDRTPLLRHLLAQQGWSRVMVFVATKYSAEHVADKLARQGIKAKPLHGELSQGARTLALGDFKAGRLQVLVATDLAARGIDIAQLPAVVNYDLPRSAVDYTHRIGRTGRAGEKGVAVSFISADTESHFRLIEKRQGQRVPRERIEGFEPEGVASDKAVPDASAHRPDPNGGIKGKRKSKKDKLREAAARQQGD
ncbi:MAG TPA: DEAD/DEAH box helicase [Aquabacterium sp.]|uniref:DEAD/DEAH box helicase n=1 Tax=Aquabacterium sp. TaxID=1872578 RepID=UPI002E36F07B|nr:DEAD/DEAH box helicase [Aquabacterium sp.]HEX5371927.1 DEAD/DEAH box helicase [Aquabacterium sp.]